MIVPIIPRLHIVKPLPLESEMQIAKLLAIIPPKNTKCEYSKIERNKTIDIGATMPNKLNMKDKIKSDLLDFNDFCSRLSVLLLNNILLSPTFYIMQIFVVLQGENSKR